MLYDYYRGIPQFPRLSLSAERYLIAKAKQGSKKEMDEIVLRHIGFVAFRINNKAFPEYRERFGSEILSEAIPVLYDKIASYDLRYRNRHGDLRPVRFSSYIWKRIDGFILDFLKQVSSRERKRVDLDPEKCCAHVSAGIENLQSNGIYHCAVGRR